MTLRQWVCTLQRWFRRIRPIFKITMLYSTRIPGNNVINYDKPSTANHQWKTFLHKVVKQSTCLTRWQCIGNSNWGHSQQKVFHLACQPSTGLTQQKKCQFILKLGNEPWRDKKGDYYSAAFVWSSALDVAYRSGMVVLPDTIFVYSSTINDANRSVAIGDCITKKDFLASCKAP